MNLEPLSQLARWRVPLGFIFGAVTFALARPTARSIAYGFIPAVAGESIRIWAAGHLEKGSGVTVSGPYACMRHPLYFGSMLMGVGTALAANRLSATVLVALYFIVTLPAAIRAEESGLRARYGDAYRRYSDEPLTFTLSPSRRLGNQGRAKERSRRFSIRRVQRNREYRAVAGLVMMLLLLVLKASACSGGD